MKQWQRFPNFKQRGEWVELQLMAAAALHGYHVLKPWGDSLEYDVAIEHHGNLTRVQVKSSTYRRGTGYYCGFKASNFRKGYSSRLVDLFAEYVIPTNAWYLIPAVAVLRHGIQGLCSAQYSRRSDAPTPTRGTAKAGTCLARPADN
jgi:hypothetical protein